jgi:hypothetical protein
VLTTAAAWTDVVTALAAVAGAVGLIGVGIQIHQTRLGREAELTMDISRRWDEEIVRRARHLVTHEYPTPQELLDGLVSLKAQKSDRFFELLAEPNYYEDLAVLCERGVLDKQIIRESLGATLYARWKRWELAVLWFRENDPANYTHFEALAWEMRDDLPPAPPSLGEWLRRPVAKGWLTQRVRLGPGRTPGPG